MQTENTVVVKRRVGRPKGKHVDWSKVGLLYKHHSDREIAEKLDCSIPAVCIRRNKAIAVERAKGTEDNDNNYIFVGNKKNGTKPRKRASTVAEVIPVAK